MSNLLKQETASIEVKMLFSLIHMQTDNDINIITDLKIANHMQCLN